LVARQILNPANFDIPAAKNDALMQTADAYFRVHPYRGMDAGGLDTAERGRELVERINLGDTQGLFQTRSFGGGHAGDAGKERGRTSAPCVPSTGVFSTAQISA
jgi:hypothetical protein